MTENGRYKESTLPTAALQTSRLPKLRRVHRAAFHLRTSSDRHCLVVRLESVRAN